MRPQFIYWCIFDFKHGFSYRISPERITDLFEIGELYTKIIEGKEADRSEWTDIQCRMRDKKNQMEKDIKYVSPHDFYETWVMLWLALGDISEISNWFASTFPGGTAKARSHQAKKLLQLLKEATTKNTRKFNIKIDSIN